MLKKLIHFKYFELYSIHGTMKAISKWWAMSFKNDMVGVPGIEPGTSTLSVLRSNQLSYTPVIKLFNY